MGPKPVGAYSIDRLDNSRPYEPGNCVWHTLIPQANNTRRNHYIVLGEERRTIAEWSRITGIKQSTIRMRLSRYGWTEEEALAPR